METGDRFLTVALYQGTPKVDTQFMLAKAGAEGVVKTSDQMQKKPQPDPTVYCTSFKVTKPFSISIYQPFVMCMYVCLCVCRDFVTARARCRINPTHNQKWHISAAS